MWSPTDHNNSSAVVVLFAWSVAVRFNKITIKPTFTNAVEAVFNKGIFKKRK